MPTKIITALALTFLLTLSAAAAHHEKPNIIYIMADDLGYGDLGSYGQTKIKTPHIDKLAKNGMRFTDYYAGSTVCASSRCVLMTGLDTGNCFIRGNGKDNLRPEDVTVAEVLKKANYATGLIGKWGLGHEGSTGMPTRQGFDTFYGYLDQHHAHNYYPTFLIDQESRIQLRNVVPDEGQWGQGIASESIEYTPALMMDETIDFIDNNKDKPFFLYLAYTLPHANNEKNRTGDGTEVPDYGIYKDLPWTKQNKGQAAMVTYLDTMVGKVMARLKKHNLTENTIVFFTSDNGPHSEGGNEVSFFDANGPVTGIKRALYDGGIRVPMIVQWPGHIPANSVTSAVAGHVDLMATAADIAGVTFTNPTNGVTFLPTLLGKPNPELKTRNLYFEFYEKGSKQAMRYGNFKAVRRPMHTGPIEVYDVTNDIGEDVDIAKLRPDLVSTFDQLMSAARTENPRWKISGKPQSRTDARKQGK